MNRLKIVVVKFALSEQNRVLSFGIADVACSGVVAVFSESLIDCRFVCVT